MDFLAILKNKTVLYIGGAAVLGVLLLGYLMIGGGPDQEEPGMDDDRQGSGAAYETFAPMAGTREGTWNNTTFGSKGSVTSTLVVNKDGTASLSADLGGLVFGLLDPPAKTFEGTYDATGIHFSADDDFFGPFIVDIMADGTFIMDASNVKAPGVERLEASGTLENSHYIVFFPGGTRAEGSVTLTKK